MRGIFLLLVGTTLLLTAPAQRNDSIIAAIAKWQLTPTAIGVPDGEPVSQSIGADGGKLISSDGKVELTIPAGALSTETVISIQPATNPVGGGFGKSYSFEPSGIHFQQPVQLVFHYSDDDLDGDAAQLMNISYQDEKGVWYGLKKRSLDTVAKTVTGMIGHFSSWILGWSYTFKPEKGSVKVLNTVIIYAYANPIGQEVAGDREEMIRDLYGSDFSKPRIWSVEGVVGGNSAVGTVESNMIMIADYTAPASVPDQDPVEVKMEIIGGTLGISEEQKSFIKTCKIHVYDSRYEVTIECNLHGPAGSVLGDVLYTDKGSFIVSMEGKKTRLTDIKNEKDFWTYKGSCSVARLHAGNGMIHMAGIRNLKVTPAQLPGQPFSLVEIAFLPSRTDFSVLNLTCPNRRGGTITMSTAAATAMLTASPALPMYIKFQAKEGEQVVQKLGDPSSEIYEKISVKQLKD